jgi:Matrixin
MRHSRLSGLLALGLSVFVGVAPALAQTTLPTPAAVEPAVPNDTQSGGEWADPLVVGDTSPSPAPPRFPSQFTNAVAPAGATRYVSVAPQRLLDTRRNFGAPGPIRARQFVTLTVAGQAGVPSNATAAVLNLTIAGATEPGFVTAYPSGQPLPDASAINVERPHQTIANLVTVSLGAGGAVDLYSWGNTDLIADVQGYYVPSASSGPGRLQPIAPRRLLDTRGGAKVPAGGELELDVVGLAGLLADTDSVAIKLTVTDATAPGYWTVYPSGTTRPDVSNLNVGQVGQTIANQVIARLSGGRLRIYSEVGGHVLIDLVGAFTGASASPSTDGLFVPIAPNRLLDTRQGYRRPSARQSFEVPVASRAGLPATGIAAVAVNVTVTDAAPGFGSVWPARNFRPNASSINASNAGQTIASHVITPVSTAGFAMFTYAGTQYIVDLAGWYVGTPSGAALPAHVPLPTPDGPPELSKYTYLFGFTATGVRRDQINPPANVPPVRWNPCQPIRYALNLSGYPESYRADVDEALDRLGSATGLSFVYVGDTTYVPQEQTPFDPTVFDTASQSDLLKALDGSLPYDFIIALGNETISNAIDGGVVGRAFPYWASNGSRLPRYVHAALIIDVDDVSGRASWSGYGVGQVLLHELGHIVGLGHADDSNQVMNPYISGATTYSTGDLRGLWQVGSARGCV